MSWASPRTRRPLISWASECWGCLRARCVAFLGALGCLRMAAWASQLAALPSRAVLTKCYIEAGWDDELGKSEGILAIDFPGEWLLVALA